MDIVFILYFLSSLVFLLIAQCTVSFCRSLQLQAAEANLLKATLTTYKFGPPSPSGMPAVLRQPRGIMRKKESGPTRVSVSNGPCCLSRQELCTIRIY